MKRILVAALLATLAATAFAGNTEYTNEAGQQDQHQPQVG